jgi:hypothetical protein
MKRWGLALVALAFLVFYNGAQQNLTTFRSMYISEDKNPEMEVRTDAQKKLRRELRRERYGPSLEWLTRLMRASSGKVPGMEDEYAPKLDGRVLSSLMVAGLASGFKSQVANLLWMKSDEYWHKGLLTRQNPLMEMVVTLDPQFIDAWSTAGWHWAYNIYADIPTSETYKNIKPESLRQKTIRQKQENAINTGLDYLSRGANMNPETYRLWFEWGWTRAEKAGWYDEETVELFKTARRQNDAREIEKTSVVDGKQVTSKEQGGLDTVGHTIAHIYEKTPNIEKALAMWGGDLLKGTPAELKTLTDVGVFWRRYGSDYSLIASLYESGDAVIKNRIRQLVPDVDRLVAAQKMRETMQARASTPTGAFVTIAARYLPAWNLKKQGRYKDAIDNLVGVMNADPKYHLTDLATMAKIYELRGDAPDAIQKELQSLRDIETTSSQDIGLHFLAVLYGDLAQKAASEKEKNAYRRLAYETWYRSRERDQLDFYALRQTRNYEDKYGFQPPQKIIDEIKKSRKSGSVKASPEVPPNVEQYYQTPAPHADENAADEL